VGQLRQGLLSGWNRGLPATQRPRLVLTDRQLGGKRPDGRLRLRQDEWAADLLRGRKHGPHPGPERQPALFGDWSNNPNGSTRFSATLAGGGGGAGDEEPAVKISGLSRKVEVQQNETTWIPASDSLTLKAGDKIHTGFKAGATLTFPDGSKLVVKPMTLVLIQSVETTGGKTTVRVWLKLGEVSATINRSRGSAVDFDVKTPTTTASSRGTVFSVLYDGATTIVSVRTDVVVVKPNSGKPVAVTAGHEVSATARAVSPATAIGKAGAPAGSVGPSRALTVITTVLARSFTACKVDADSVLLKPVTRGWRATIKIVGARKGLAIWTFAGTALKPNNSLAKLISRGCR
jgi:hypothetical protein